MIVMSDDDEQNVPLQVVYGNRYYFNKQCCQSVLK